MLPLDRVIPPILPAVGVITNSHYELRPEEAVPQTIIAATAPFVSAQGDRQGALSDKSSSNICR
jgi:hypothetical protein